MRNTARTISVFGFFDCDCCEIARGKACSSIACVAECSTLYFGRKGLNLLY
jgi:hypothetical protein